MSIAVEALDFDPYRAWLNITAAQRPLSPYQLLALVPLESDASRIRAAYARQQSAMLMHFEKAEPRLWQTVKQEVEDAFALLCDPEQKAVLDAGIRRKSGGPKPAGSASGAAGNLACRHCEHTNPTSRRFCGGCGAALWEQCPQCQAECAADERFCGSCGTDILGGLSDHSKQLQAKLAEGQELAAALRFDAAISCLRGVAAVSDARFDRLARQALLEIERVEEQRRQLLAAAEAGLARARHAMKGHGYEEVVMELQEIPAPLRSSEAAVLLARADAARKDLLSLGGEIRAAIEEKRTANLLPKVERLLTLKPGHKQALAIAEQLRDQMVRLAKKALSGHKYREALDQLDQVTPSVRSAEVETLAETASELLALLDGAKQAALADRKSLALAERLVKLAAGNEEAARLREQLAQRATSQPPDPRYAAANFAPVPKRTLLGPPVDWLARPARFPTADERASNTLGEHPGQFFVALGLALQGLDAAAIAIDLSPEVKTGMLAMLPALSLGKRSVAAAWGLDLSDSALKAVKLVKDAKTGGVLVAATEYILHERPLTNQGDDLRRPEIVERTLVDFAGRCGELKGTKLVIGMPGLRVLGRFFELPPLPAKKVEGAIAYEARHQLPIALEELCWEGHVLEAPGAKAADAEPRRIVVAAAREAHVRERVAAFKSAGLHVDGVGSDCVALHNALIHEFLAGNAASDGDGSICALDVGTASTNVVVSSRSGLWFRTIGQGGDSFTAALIKQLGLTNQQAELVKREPAKARRYSQWCDAVRPVLVQLAGEFERSLASHAKLCPDQQVRQIYGLGGAFQTQGLLRHLRFGK